MAQERFQDIRALLVDDVSFSAIRLKRSLEHLGIPEVATAGNGVTACELLESGKVRPNLIIADFHMPKMDGLELLKRVRTGGVAGLPHDVVFIILTGYLELDRSIPAIRLGADGVLRKPLTAAVAGAKLAQLFGPNPPRTVGGPELYGDVELASGGELQAEAATAAPNDGEREMPIDKVAPGAVLARDLDYPNGKTLVRKGAILAPALLYRLQEVADLSGGIGRVWVRG